MKGYQLIMKEQKNLMKKVFSVYFPLTGILLLSLLMIPLYKGLVKTRPKKVVTYCHKVVTLPISR